MKSQTTVATAVLARVRSTAAWGAAVLTVRRLKALVGTQRIAGHSNAVDRFMEDVAIGEWLDSSLTSPSKSEGDLAQHGVSRSS